MWLPSPRAVWDSSLSMRSLAGSTQTVPWPQPVAYANHKSRRSSINEGSYLESRGAGRRPAVLPGAHGRVLHPPLSRHSTQRCAAGELVGDRKPEHLPLLRFFLSDREPPDFSPLPLPALFPV